MIRQRRRRELTEDEIDLWLHVTSSVVARPGAARPEKPPEPVAAIRRRNPSRSRRRSRRWSAGSA